jgi:hypothetical protein
MKSEQKVNKNQLKKQKSRLVAKAALMVKSKLIVKCMCSLCTTPMTNLLVTKF